MKLKPHEVVLGLAVLALCYIAVIDEDARAGAAPAGTPRAEEPAPDDDAHARRLSRAERFETRLDRRL